MSEASYTLTYMTVGTVMYVLAAYKTAAWVSQRIPVLLLMAGGALAAGTGFISAAPVVYRWIGQASGIANVATLVVYTSITFTCAIYLSLVLLWLPTDSTTATRDRRAVRTLLRVAPPYIAAVLVMMVTFFAADVPRETPLTFDTTFADRAIILVFLLVYQAAFGAGIWSMAYVCWRRARDIQDRVLRGSLHRIVVGCILVGGYGICKIIAISGAALGYTALEPLSTTIGPALASFGGVVVASGWVYAAIRTRRQRRRDFRALETLWITATQADRGVILKSPPSRSAFDFHTLRRAGEIRDGQLALRPWTSQDIVDTARRLANEHGLDPADREALTAAAALQGALRALESGQVPQRPCQDPPGLGVPTDAERRHLVAVARQLDSSLVTQALSEASEQ